MRAVSRSATGRKVFAVVAAGLLVAGAGTLAIAAPIWDPDVRVDRVVDGETLAVRVGDEERLVVLAGVDAPGLGQGDEDPPCLGDRARDFVAELLPPGTVVELRSGAPPTDDQGREVDAVFVGDVLVNAEVVRAGLAVPVRGAGEALDETLAGAAREGRLAGVGLYDAENPCTLPARAAALEAEVMAAMGQARKAGSDLVALQAAEVRLAAAATEARELQQLLAGDQQELPLAAYPTSVGAMRILVDRGSAKIVREQAGVQATIAETHTRSRDLADQDAAGFESVDSTGVDAARSGRPGSAEDDRATGTNATTGTNAATGTNGAGGTNGATGAGDGRARGSDGAAETEGTAGAGTRLVRAVAESRGRTAEGSAAAAATDAAAAAASEAAARVAGGARALGSGTSTTSLGAQRPKPPAAHDVDSGRPEPGSAGDASALSASAATAAFRDGSPDGAEDD